VEFELILIKYALVKRKIKKRRTEEKSIPCKPLKKTFIAICVKE